MRPSTGLAPDSGLARVARPNTMARFVLADCRSLKQQKSPSAGLFDGRYWARTSGSQFVESELPLLGFRSRRRRQASKRTSFGETRGPCLRARRHPAHIPQRLRSCQHRIPPSSRTRPPEAPGQTRQSPQRQARKGPLPPAIPAYPRSARKHHDRPVTPEVAGSSPVAPVKFLQIASFFWRLDVVDRRPLFHPAWIPHADRPGIPARRRSSPVIPAPETTGDVAGRPLTGLTAMPHICSGFRRTT